MSHPQPTMPTFEPAPTMTEAEIQEAKRLEKLQSHSSSHHTAGTHEPPPAVASGPSDGILWQLKAESDHR